MFISGTTGDNVYPYTLSTPWDVTTAVYDGAALSVGGQDTSPNGICFDPTGRTMLMVGNGSGSVHRYVLGTPWNVTTAVYDGAPYSVSTPAPLPKDVFVDESGVRMYVVSQTNNSVVPWLVGRVVAS
jgi:sugar lactone lactonase YvrE